MLETKPKHYWLRNAHVPASLVVGGTKWTARKPPVDNLLSVDIEIEDGVIAAITTAGTFSSYAVPSIDLMGGMVLPCFVDLHTHLDKGHLWERVGNPDGTFAGALKACIKAGKKWNEADVYRRFEFGLKCSYAHGTQAIRTHLDSAGKQGEIGFAVFERLREEWCDRITLQAVSLVRLDYYLTKAGEKLADLVALKGGVLGGVAYQNADLVREIDRTFELAKERNLDLDFHVDETDDPNSRCLRAIAEATIRHRYRGRVVCGHCCSLAMQEEGEAMETIALVKKAAIGIVSLPMCNLYLQDRVAKRTPRWRGITLLHELRGAGVPVALASDNCRDPFYGFGDHDGLEVFMMGVRVGHLDRPYGDWVGAVSVVGADLMGLGDRGRVGVGLGADLVLFRGRGFSELLSRNQGDRVVLRAGVAIDAVLPDYRDLDDL